MFSAYSEILVVAVLVDKIQVVVAHGWQVQVMVCGSWVKEGHFIFLGLWAVYSMCKLFNLFFNILNCYHHAVCHVCISDCHGIECDSVVLVCLTNLLKTVVEHPFCLVIVMTALVDVAGIISLCCCFGC